MKILSHGAVSLALLSMVGQVVISGYGFGPSLGQSLGSSAHAQSTTASPSSTGIQLPASLTGFQSAFSLTQVKLEQGMQACFAKYGVLLRSKGIADEVTQGLDSLQEATKSRVKKYREGKKSGDRKEKTGAACSDKGFFDLVKTDRKAFCSASCEKPDLGSKDCGDLFTGYTGQKKADGETAAKNLKNQFSLYIKYVQESATACSFLEVAEIEAKLALLKCQEGAMSAAVTDAVKALNAIQAQNQMVIDDMKATEGALNSQVGEMEKLLGTEKNPGLMQMQEFLEGGEFAKFSEFAATAPDQEKEITLKEEGLKQQLVQRKNAQFATCLSGTGGTSGSSTGAQTCRKDGKNVPCSPLDRVKEELQNVAILTKNGQVILTGDREMRMKNIESAFQDFVERLNTQLGGPAGRNEKGEPLAPGAYGNATRAMTVDQLLDLNRDTIERLNDLPYGPSDQRRAAARFRLRDRLRNAFSGCYNSAEQWRVREESSPGYKNAQNENKKLRTKLNEDLDRGLQQARKVYSNALQSLGFRGARVLDLSTCSVSTRDRASCAQQIKAQLLNLKGGTGISLTSLKIPALGKVGGFTIPCQGIDGCVKALQESKGQRETQLNQVKSQRNSLAAKSNAEFDQTMKAFSQILSRAQASLQGSFGEMLNLASKLGVDGMKLEYLDGETPETPQEGELVKPKDMTRVLSAQVPPKGLVNFTGSGADEVLVRAKEKAKENEKEKLSELRDDKDELKDFNEKVKACIKDNDPSSKDNVGSGACGLECQEGLAKCNEGKKATGYEEIVKAVTALYTSSSSAPSAGVPNFSDALQKAQELTGACEDYKKLCYSCVETKGTEWWNRAIEEKKAEAARDQ
jgi:hypothetical protein